MYLFAKKPIAKLLAEAESSEKGLKRTLSATNLIALGIGAIIGAGLFVRTAAAAAQNAGPSVTISFIVAGIGCALAGLCYAEFSSTIPIAGSAYTYSYATMGELVAWIIGWDLILEYAVGAATVGIAWSEYLNNLLVNVFHWKGVAYAWCHSPFEQSHILTVAKNTDLSGLKGILSPDLMNMLSAKLQLVLDENLFKRIPAIYQHDIITYHGIINIPALGIVTLLSLLLIRGTKESAFFNGLIVITKVSIVILIIVIGWHFINPVNHANYIPKPSIYYDNQHISHHYGGILGILGAAGVVFFAFIGFDAVSTTAQEARNPKKDMPIGILGSLVICTILYILFAHVLTGIATIDDFRTSGKEASVAFAIQKYMVGYQWLAKFVTVAILAGFSSVILVMLLGQSRVFYSMSRDGLLPAMFSDVHEKYQTPHRASLITLVLVGLFAAFVPGDIVGDMTSIGTLFAFMLVCAGVIIMRKTEPDLVRQFKTPWVPWVPLLGIVVCGAMIFGLGWTNWLRLVVWLLIGLVIYFSYSRHRSKLR